MVPNLNLVLSTYNLIWGGFFIFIYILFSQLSCLSIKKEKHDVKIFYWIFLPSPNQSAVWFPLKRRFYCFFLGIIYWYFCFVSVLVLSVKGFSLGIREGWGWKVFHINYRLFFRANPPFRFTPFCLKISLFNNVQYYFYQSFGTQIFE